MHTITSSLMNSTPLFNSQFKIAPKNHQNACRLLPRIQATLAPEENTMTLRRKVVTAFLSTSVAAGVQGLGNTTPPAMAENWGTRSFIWEKFFEPDLSPEDAAARIRQTAQGLHSLREMLEAMSWNYVLMYIRQKQSYLSKDMKNAIVTIPRGRWKSYIATANELVDNMAEFDIYVRTPKVYESYLYYEKTLKSIDDLVALLA
ncbi:photosynthetic NDH subunit of lumenal location 2, chloroplastic [Coffea eugenioides]|uniref:photosynthetic NDH subunit of lumenal location 2, chloroplastic n=1 Tax=Coffea eugenioides TaxID=49369 RepID=UPI000F611C19|nr:photosynthetic NDH subunit of lumenal location 2, chloroplastic [Coffea eugenioides]